jgi:hypothetical protein
MATHGFGHPTFIPQQDLPVPAEVDDEYLSDIQDGSQLDGVPSRLTFFVLNLRLTGLLAKVNFLEGRNNVHSARQREIDDLYVMIDVNSDLDDFLENLPDYLRVKNDTAFHSDPQPEFFQLQGHVLKSR